MKIDIKIAKQILSLIKYYDTIVIFRHDSPDFDALGSQFGMYHFLKDNFKDKKILTAGYRNTNIGHGLYPENDTISDEVYAGNFLAIVLDTANTQRVSDSNFKNANAIIKIDHHPNKEPFGAINLVDDSKGSCAEWIYELLTSKPFSKYFIGQECAKFLYSGIVGDTGRFQFSSTTDKTLIDAGELLSLGFNPVNEVYEPMYKKDFSHFEATKYVLNHYGISKNGVAYYHLDTKSLKKLGLDSDDGKEFLSLFNYYDEIKVWCCFVEDERKGNWRGSIRSRHIVVNEACANFPNGVGGGHDFASGIRVNTYEDTLKLIQVLDEEVVKQEGK